MIPSSIVNQIKRLLAEGKYSQRKIARMIGVSRGTVGAIARGKRPDYETSPSGHETELEQPTGPPERCPGCGGVVSMPCRLCRVRKLIAERRVARRPPRPAEILKLELRGDQRTRYEEVRLRRTRESAPHGEDQPGLPTENEGKTTSTGCCSHQV